ncbi:sensor histidine kinase [Phycicoccus sonneratiae]|uniref:histidine kinase n=1 Tax=Phycicoccus sonneratiae TaxID=2807628 RepID=A0ABS2CIW8_9MICO|nr:histidine kinase [Phycicoccus sonneraticus]MBM6399809.1 hypothetical protein [Phycicoccus sonneraticus]
MRRVEQLGIVVGVLLVVVLPLLLHGPPRTPVGLAFAVLVTTGSLALARWRDSPRAASSLSLGLLLAAFVVAPGEWFPDTAIVVLSAGFAVLALGWSGRAAVVVGVLAAGYVAGLVVIGASGGSEVAALVFTVPGFVAGTIFRLRRETADALAERAAELEREQQELTELSVRQERRRIAGELHDVVGHALSVLVIQAAAGQRLVDSAPERVGTTFGVIAESARRGTADLGRLVELLGGTAPGEPGLALVDDVVAHAVRSGLDVTCRVDGDTARVPEASAHLAYRVVQEGLTNALRHAPGAPVRIGISTDRERLAVSVENDPATGAPALRGSGLGLAGLRERVGSHGGGLGAGPTGGGGWRLEATLPLGAAP